MSSGIPRERFGPIRSAPPGSQNDPLSADNRWEISRIGSDGAFPNGGLWRFDSPARSIFVKRTGSAYLGGEPVWQLSLDSQDPQWWGREAAFYGSELARAGWSDTCGPPACFAVETRSDEIDLWLEYVDTIPLPVSDYESAVQGLARWQAENKASDSPVLSRGWRAQHVSRRHLNNRLTTIHSGWERLFAAGLSENARIWAQERIVDSVTIETALQVLPQVPTHHDFHHMNIGSTGVRTVILDWATVGWGPVGHDVGNLVIDRAADGDLDPGELWFRLLDAYGRELRGAGLDIDQATIERSAAVSSTIRVGWLLDVLLDGIEKENASSLLPLIPTANLLTDLAISVGRSDHAG